MDKTNAERQRRHRARRQQNHKALLDELAALRARVIELEAALVARPKAASGRAQAVLKRERDELAVTLRQIEAYQPGIAEKAKAWVAEMDKPARRRRGG